MQFTGRVADVSIDFNSKQPKITFLINEKEALSQVDEIKDIEKLSIEAKKYRQQRSLDANAYFHVLVNKLARKIGMVDDEMKIKMNLSYGTIATNIDGTKVGVEVPKGTDINKFYQYAKWYGERQIGDLMFDKYLFYKPTHELDTKEMAQLIDGVVYECQEQGIETMPEEELKSLLGAWKK